MALRDSGPPAAPPPAANDGQRKNLATVAFPCGRGHGGGGGGVAALDEPLDAPVVLPLPPARLSESLFYLCASQRAIVERLPLPAAAPLRALAAQLPGWVPYRLVQLAQGHTTGAIDAAERSWGPFLWATEFENVHSSWTGFAEPGFEFQGRHWRGSEQLYQACKAGEPGSAPFEAQAARFAAAAEMEAYGYGQVLQLRPDWHSNKATGVAAKDGAMERAVRLKFSDPALRLLLESTRGHQLCSIKGDDYWGAGLKGRGRNRLPELLMALRDSGPPAASPPAANGGRL
jgi:hypothetical protein